MDCLELDNELIQLTKAYARKNIIYDNLEMEIEALEDEKSDLGDEIDIMEKQIEKIKKQLLEQKMEQLSTFTDDPFINDFIKASYFTEKSDDCNRPLFNLVNITENTIEATDARRLIAIKNDAIPATLKNTKIKWDVRQDFEDNISNFKTEFPATGGIIKDAKKGTYQGKVKVAELCSKYNAKITAQGQRGYIATLDFVGQEISFNKTFLDQALMVFDGAEVDLYTRDKISPILMENEKVTVLLCPTK